MTETGIVQVGTIGFRRRELAVYDEDTLDGVRLEASREIIYHFTVIAMSGETFDFGDLRLDLAVKTKDRNPL